ncbi:MAG: hypothetical protein R2991_07305 [Thermoanaerobaculia bacterium]
MRRLLVLLTGLGLAAAPALADGPDINMNYAHVQAATDAGRISGLLNQVTQLYDNFHEFQEANDALNPDDLGADPNYSPAGAPQLPTRCLDAGDTGCMACYESAQHEINFLRVNLERLRAIYAATKKYSDKAIAFGDSMAGLPGGFGMGWPEQRFGIQAEMEKLGHTYDEKYNGMIANLERSLKQLSECEAQYFDTPDWYDRFGFIYYTFMADRYKRAD